MVSKKKAFVEVFRCNCKVALGRELVDEILDMAEIILVLTVRPLCVDLAAPCREQGICG